MPKISVIVPNYNHARFLEQRIDSILTQTFQDFELILLDDCSTDNSIEILEKYRTHPKVSHLIFNQKNSGSTFYQWKKGINLAKGEFIWVAESDDYCEIIFLDKLLVAFQNTKVVLSYCQSNLTDENNITTNTFAIYTNYISSSKWRQNYYNDGLDEINTALSFSNTIPNASAVLFKKEAFQSKYLELDMNFCADWIFWARIIKSGEIYFCAEPLNHFRHHNQSTRNQYSKEKMFQYLKQEIVALDKFKEEFFITKERYTNVLDRILLRWFAFFTVKEHIFLFGQVRKIPYFSYKRWITYFLKKINKY